MNAPRRASPPAAAPLGERDIDRLQTLLDALPEPLEPLDVSMLDGFLCGVLLQPRPVPAERWLPFVTDADGRAVPAGVDTRPLLALVGHRHAELAAAIEQRQWFDPWVFELEAAPQAPGDPESEDEGQAVAASEAVYPWVAGFAAAMTHFPALTDLPAQALSEPLALVYRHLDPADLEDADDLLALIDSLQPPADLAQAVEQLVRATLLLADVARPQRAGHAPPQRGRPSGPARGSRSARR